MPGGVELIAMSPLGERPTRMGLSWDTALYHLISKRRKPLGDLWMHETWRQP
jgi:hypothetical protein